MEVIFLFPHQLSLEHPILENNHLIYLIESKRHFTDYSFHKQKLVLHRASMQAFADALREKGKRVSIVEFHAYEHLEELMKKKKAKVIHYIDTVDHKLEQEIKTVAKKQQVHLKRYQSNNFFLEEQEVKKTLENQDHYYQYEFYKAQRKRFSILMDGNEPKGGKWSYDKNNRKKLPKDIDIPKPWFPKESEEVKEAKKYVEKYFGKNPGSITSFTYPINRKQALKALRDFLENRLYHFGTYQDAMDMEKSYVFHSVLSSSINIGLLSPQEVVSKVIDYGSKHKIALHTIEGFVRQILGWREFIRGVYLLEGEQQKKENFFKHERKLSKAFWTASTDILPVDNVIKKSLETAYAHHIERLMIMSNFMLLCELHPKGVYSWFMEMYIDAYDWVMVPNVYGMGQYADKGSMITKPYISSSNYLRKMGHFEHGKWETIWDSLYWRFIHKHITVFKDNPRLALMASHLEKMDKDKRKKYLSTANTFLKKL